MISIGLLHTFFTSNQKLWNNSTRWYENGNSLFDTAGRDKQCLHCRFVNVDALWEHTHVLERERKFSREITSVLSQPYFMLSQVHVESGLCRCLKYGTPPFTLSDFFCPADRDSTFRIPYPTYLKTLAENTVHRDYRRKFLHKFSLKRLRGCLGKNPDSQHMTLKIWDSESDIYRWAEAGFIPPVCPDGAATLFFREINGKATMEHQGQAEEEACREEQEFDIGQLMEACHIYFHSLRRNKLISYMWIGTLRGKYLGNEHLLKQCLYGLLENAILFNREGGNVRVKMEKQAMKEKPGYDHFRIEIRDTGVDMTEEQKELLSPPFTGKEKDATPKTEPPAGMRLATAKLIMDALHGRLEVENELGRGTTVTMYFSLMRAKPSGTLPKKLMARKD